MLLLLLIKSSLTIAASRVTYAYSRDGAMPFSSWLSRVNKNTQTPVNAIWFIIGCSGVVGLLMFAGPIVIGAVFSLAVIAQYIAFTIPILLKVTVAGDKFRHGKPSFTCVVARSSNCSLVAGNVLLHITLTEPRDQEAAQNLLADKLVGPWNLGRFSRPIGIIACSWVALFIVSFVHISECYF